MPAEKICSSHYTSVSHWYYLITIIAYMRSLNIQNLMEKIHSLDC